MATVPVTARSGARSRPRSGNVERLLSRGGRGQGLSRNESLVLLEQAETSTLLQAACRLRTRAKGRTISFSKKVFIPLTTLCRDFCAYCTFRKAPGQPGAHFMTPQE